LKLRLVILTNIHALLLCCCCLQFVPRPTDDDSDDDAAAADDDNSKYLHELPQLHEAPAASLDINTTRQVRSTPLQR
jgi:hypothetical protein